MNIITRAQWGAKPPLRPLIPQATPAEAYLHHTVGYGAGGAAYMRQMQDQHQAKGWRDIAYNFVLDPHTGDWYEGQGALKVPAAQHGHNAGTIAVCVMGNWHPEPPPPATTNHLVAFMRHAHANGWSPRLLTGGHRDAPGSETTCPGNYLHALIPTINARLEEPMIPDHLDVQTLTADHIFERGARDGVDSTFEADWEWMLAQRIATTHTHPDGVVRSEELAAFLHRLDQHIIRPLAARLTAAEARIAALEQSGGGSGLTEAHVRAMIAATRLQP